MVSNYQGVAKLPRCGLFTSDAKARHTEQILRLSFEIVRLASRSSGSLLLCLHVDKHVRYGRGNV